MHIPMARKTKRCAFVSGNHGDSICIPDGSSVFTAPTALVVGAGGACLDIFTFIYPFLFSFSLSLGDGPI